MAWTLMSTVLVLGMFPGVAFFEAGLLRRKNTTSLLAQVFCGLSCLSVMWVLVGFSLTFGPDAGGRGFIGTLGNGFLADVHFRDCYVGPNGPTTVPTALYAMFQMMFACITPLLMTGAYAERLAWVPFVLFTVLWEVVVYYPVAHWMWSADGWLAVWGAQDFAGGIVIHTTAGVSSLVAVAMLGRRHLFFDFHGEFPYSSLPVAAIGATLLWTGWMGFNGGSALAANGVAVHAVVNSQIAASVSSCVYMLIVYWKTGKPSTVAILNGAVAGLAGVTPASGFITPVGAFVLGVLLGSGTYFGIWLLKHRLHLDDALDVSTVHGLTGVIGSLFIGFGGYASVSGANGVVATAGQDWSLLGKQLVAVVVCGGWAGVWTFLILFAISRRTPLRVAMEVELAGLDVGIHAEACSFGASVRRSFAEGHGRSGPPTNNGAAASLPPTADNSVTNERVLIAVAPPPPAEPATRASARRSHAHASPDATPPPAQAREDPLRPSEQEAVATLRAAVARRVSNGSGSDNDSDVGGVGTRARGTRNSVRETLLHATAEAEDDAM